MYTRAKQVLLEAEPDMLGGTHDPVVGLLSKILKRVSKLESDVATLKQEKEEE